MLYVKVVGGGGVWKSNPNCCLCWASELAAPPANLTGLERWQPEMGKTGWGRNLLNWLCCWREPAVELHPPSGRRALAGARAQLMLKVLRCLGPE